MSQGKLIRVPCPQCGKAVGVRPDQFGRKLRCPSCTHKFRIEAPASHFEEVRGETNLPAATEAGEIVVARPAREQPRGSTTATATFVEPPGVVLDAVAFSVRRAGCEVLDVDRNNLRLKFAAHLDGIRTECAIYVFATPTDGAELDMRIPSVGSPSQAILYTRIAAEITDYLATRRKTEKLPTIDPAPPRRDDEDKHDPPVRTKYCQECGVRIRARAEICPKCGVGQPNSDRGTSRAGPTRDSIKIPLLISAISNIVVGLIWASTCVGIVLTVPMVILCIFEFSLWSKADSLQPRRLGEDAKRLSIFEIVVGIANTPTLICGIIIQIKSGKLASRRRDDEEDEEDDEY